MTSISMSAGRWGADALDFWDAHRRTVAAVVVPIAVALFLLCVWRQRHFFHDDAFISLRYARNLVDHHQFVWNDGERVEGYTNFLHLVAASALIEFGVDPVVAVRTINLAGVALLFFATARASRRLFPAPDDTLLRRLPVVLVLTSGPVAMWMLGGLEAVLVAGLIAAAVATVLPLFLDADAPPRAAALAGLLFALACLTRPDAIVSAAATGIAVLAVAPLPPRRRIAAAVLFGTGVVAPLLLHAAWAWSYYGDLLPNTFYAKTGVPVAIRIQTGFLYIAKSMAWFPGIVLAVVLAAVVVRLRRTTPVLLLLAACVALQFVYVWWVGGDHMRAGRFFVPIVAPAALLVAVAIGRFEGRIRWLLPFAFGLALVGSLAFPRHGMDPAAYVGGVVGAYIEKTWPPHTLIALHTAGSTPYEALDMRFLDMLGLNDRAIARRTPLPILTERQRWPGHARGDGAYVLARKPDFIVMGPAQGTLETAPWFLSDVELAASPEFHTCYRPETVTITHDRTSGISLPDRPDGAPVVFTYYRRVCA